MLQCHYGQEWLVFFIIAMLVMFSASRFLRCSAFYIIRGSPAPLHPIYMKNLEFLEALEEEFGASAHLLVSLLEAPPAEGTKIPVAGKIIQPFLQPLKCVSNILSIYYLAIKKTSTKKLLQL